MTVKDRIIKLLEDAGVEYRSVEHEPVYTSKEAAEIRDTSASMGAKALICSADEKPVLIVVPGNQKVDFREFKDLYNVADLHLLSPERVKELTGLEVGSIPPVGKAMDIPSYYDTYFQEANEVAFNAGLHTFSIVMKAKDLIKIEQPIFGDFACSMD
jgi:Ala-tRNA(Pro) deacylase